VLTKQFLKKVICENSENYFKYSIDVIYSKCKQRVGNICMVKFWWIFRDAYLPCCKLHAVITYIIAYLWLKFTRTHARVRPEKYIRKSHIKHLWKPSKLLVLDSAKEDHSCSHIPLSATCKLYRYYYIHYKKISRFQNGKKKELMKKEA